MTDEDSDESSIYDEDGREEMVDDDEMSSGEEGFMRGYDEAEEHEKHKEKKEEEDEEEKED
ncbi:MAG: hypothetical protein KJ601_05635 [Nanoarchaeota archaeon]|nr:hypothetical protein [Nanoarchaeota archaeon]MBU1704742.1 hypothetical protein [Nanoarchaeota archaeon]